ncbi:hypothetical protein HG1285_14349 [Hydrogenivirga sp. 128-5-R1-1]|nr:hypothetical protein HG1285_14349 [Hydrogenivirga sp. 128-5-R1-1]
MDNVLIYYLILVGGMAAAGLFVYFLAVKGEKSAHT